jgi:hypothetical protein
LDRVLEPLADWLRYFFRERRLPGCPLVAVVHPWETGWDNSPRWDLLPAAGLKPKRPYQRLDTRSVGASQRPSGRDYDGYVALAEIISEGGFELAAYRSRTPFVVYDTLFDALCYGAARELNRMAEHLDREQPFPGADLADFARAFEEYHWNRLNGTYYDFDAQGGRQLEVDSAAPLAAVGSGLLDSSRAAYVCDRYLARCDEALPVCTFPPGSPGFDADLYWRGPVWLNVNWLVVDGLRRLRLDRLSTGLAARSLAAFAPTGFTEYVNPLTGEARGIRSFSWTAALVLDLLRTA